MLPLAIEDDTVIIELLHTMHRGDLIVVFPVGLFDQAREHVLDGRLEPVAELQRGEIVEELRLFAESVWVKELLVRIVWFFASCH